MRRTNMKTDYTPIQVRGTAVYAKVYKKDELADKFVLPLVVTDKKELAKLEAAGMKPAARRDGTLKSFESLGFPGPVFEFKSLHSPRVVDSSGSRDITNLIGNGSEVMMHGSTRPYTLGSGGVAGYLKTVQVINLIEYNPEGGKTDLAKGDVPAIDGGFIASEDASSSASEDYI